MRQYLAIIAALAALGMGSAAAQQREAVLHKVEVPAAGFDIVLATAKPDGWTFDPQAHPQAAIVLMGDGLAYPFTEDLVESLKGARAVTLPSCAFQAEVRGRPLGPVAVYVVPKDRTRFTSTQR